MVLATLCWPKVSWSKVRWPIFKLENMTIWSKISESKTNIYLLAYFGHILVDSFVNLGLFISVFDSFSEIFLSS